MIIISPPQLHVERILPSTILCDELLNVATPGRVVNQKEQLDPLWQRCWAKHWRQGGKVAPILANECTIEFTLPASELIDNFLLNGKLFPVVLAVEGGESLPERGLLLVQKKSVADDAGDLFVAHGEVREGEPDFLLRRVQLE